MREDLVLPWRLGRQGPASFSLTMTEGVRWVERIPTALDAMAKIK